MKGSAASTNVFAIDATSGQITLMRDLAAAEAGMFALTVTATDDGTPPDGMNPLSATETFEVTVLPPHAGFALTGEAAGDDLGRSVSSAGDINGDGIDDFVIGAIGHDAGSQTTSGAVYVVYGIPTGRTGPIDLSTLQAEQGFVIYHSADMDNSGLGVSVSAAGDFDGDGIDDLIVGAYNFDSDADGSAADDHGRAWVIYGKQGDGTQFGSAEMDGSNGDTWQAGRSMSAPARLSWRVSARKRS